MKRLLAVAAAAALLATGLQADATSVGHRYRSVDHLAGKVVDQGVQLTWAPVHGTSVLVVRDDRTVATLQAPVEAWLDRSPLPGTHRYEVVRLDGTGPAQPLLVRAPSYLV